VTEHEWRRHSDEILSAVASVRGVSEVRGPRDSPVDEFRSEADPDACARAGLADAQVASWVMPSFPGGLTLTLRDVHGPLPIRLVVANSAADPDRRVIPHGRVSTARGPMDLRLLITGRWHRRAAALCREDGRRVYLVTVDDGHGATGGLQEDLVSSLRRVPLPPGASIRVGLLSREATDSAASVWAAIALSLVLMFMILAAEYGSVVLALIVLVTSPLAFIGAVAALAIAGEPLGVLSLAGVVVTVGAVDNDAVIAIDVIAAKLGHGAQLAEAIVDGMVLRFRPMVITSLTTVLGMAPLLWQSGSGSVMVRSLAIPLTGGLIASTIATVLVIPSVIAIVGHRAILRPDLGRGCAIGG
jgi:HAE1 family hydrophobic/amphiphilic exporter-1